MIKNSNLQLFSTIKFVVFGLTLVIVDQLSKFYVIKNLPSIVVHNNGVVFGLISNQFYKWLIIVLGFIAFYYIITQLKVKDFYLKLGLFIVFSGIISNLIDRIRFGAVIDFWRLPGFLSWWPTFNIADVFIFIGTLIIIIFSFKQKN